MNIEEEAIKSQIAQLKIMVLGLEDRLKEIQKNRDELEKKTPSPYTFPNVPWSNPLPMYPYPSYPPTHCWPRPRCSKCNIELLDVMMYTCNREDCPTNTRVTM